MFNYFYTIIKSNNPRFFYHKALLIMTAILIIYYLYKFSEPPKKKVEGFTQESPFVLKTGLAVYDDFYAEVYDGITDRSKTCQRELYEIIKMTEPDTKNSTILDIGSGTGCVVAELADAGYNAYGLDRSQAMIDISQAKYPDLSFIKGDMVDTMAFEKGLFTHILCTNFTVYEFSDKKIFFSNCYNWLKPNGYLVLHLVDKEKFSARTFKDSIMDLTGLWRTMQPVSKERKTTTTAEFVDFLYDATYEFKQETVILKETFKDKETQHIRQNENTMRMESIEDILKMASNSGFIMHAKTSMASCGQGSKSPTTNLVGGFQPPDKFGEDENQYLYVFERAM